MPPLVWNMVLGHNGLRPLNFKFTFSWSTIAGEKDCTMEQSMARQGRAITSYVHLRTLVMDMQLHSLWGSLAKSSINGKLGTS